SNMFGKGWRKNKKSKPITFCFFENGSLTATRHIHTITHFPKSILNRGKEYMDRFAIGWMTWSANKDADREYWYEEVRDNDAITRYCTKKVIGNQESWFVLN
ncbi:MAG: hypothetical protein QGG48_02040, partial [Desulfatiglandales bacterium]|nr:hypothetical protein [Desulfatiglandales bacterium]